MVKRRNQCLRQIAMLTRGDIGESEDDVGSNLLIPLLECLGHSGKIADAVSAKKSKRIRILTEDLPPDSRIVVQARGYDEDLSTGLDEVSEYAFQEGALLAVIANGHEIRVYAPLVKGVGSKYSLLYSFRREGLSETKNIEVISRLLSSRSLKTGDAKAFVEARRREIASAYSRVREIAEHYEARKKRKLVERRQLVKTAEELQSRIAALSKEIKRLEAEARKRMSNILAAVGLPPLTSEAAIYHTGDDRGPWPGWTTDTSSSSYANSRRSTGTRGKYRGRNEYWHSGNTIEIRLGNEYPMKYHLIPVGSSIRHLFPGYRVEFDLETDMGVIPCKVSSRTTDAKVGDRVAGKYITSVERNALTEWYRRHDLRVGDKLMIEIVQEMRRYRLTVSRGAD